jgi:hypothetical protein
MQLWSGPAFWFIIHRGGETFTSHITILKAYEMAFPISSLSQKSTYALQFFRHSYLNGPIFNEIKREIYLLQVSMSKNRMRCFYEICFKPDLIIYNLLGTNTLPSKTGIDPGSNETFFSLNKFEFLTPNLP